MLLNGQFDTLIWNSPCVESPWGPAGGSGTGDRNEAHVEQIETEVSLTRGIVVFVVLELWYGDTSGFQFVPFPLEMRHSIDRGLIVLSRANKLVGHGRVLLTFEGAVSW